jgi:hypothetical protein
MADGSPDVHEIKEADTKKLPPKNAIKGESTHV